MTTSEMYIRLVVDYVRRCLRVMHVAMKVTQKHAPRWIALAIPIALIIPGPQDELIVALLIAWAYWRRPLMRAELKRGIRGAWAA